MLIDQRGHRIVKGNLEYQCTGGKPMRDEGNFAETPPGKVLGQGRRQLAPAVQNLEVGSPDGKIELAAVDQVQVDNEEFIANVGQDPTRASAFLDEHGSNPDIVQMLGGSHPRDGWGR